MTFPITPHHARRGELGAERRDEWPWYALVPRQPTAQHEPQRCTTVSYRGTTNISRSHTKTHHVNVSPEAPVNRGAAHKLRARARLASAGSAASGPCNLAFQRPPRSPKLSSSPCHLTCPDTPKKPFVANRPSAVANSPPSRYPGGRLDARPDKHQGRAMYTGCSYAEGEPAV